ncbi:MAG: hypothetical protein ABIR48_08280 [Gammaproteobacteria bacterium]
MKALFILLVLLNLSFLAWQVNNEEPGFTPPAYENSADNSKRLVLLRELDAEMAKMNSPSNSPEASSQ